MTDVYAGHSQFVLLNNDNRRRKWFDLRTFLLLGLISLPVIIFCGIYTIMLKNNDQVLYPKTNHPSVPSWKDGRPMVYAKDKKENSNNKYWESPLFDAQKIPRSSTKTGDDFKLVCYYNFPGSDPDALQPENIDPHLCSHINVGFTRVSQDFTLHLEDAQLDIVERMRKLKRANKDLKILVSVGGAGDDTGFPNMVYNHTNRKKFIKSVLDCVKEHKIDGVDLDWEFPNETPAGDPRQKIHFTQLLLELRKTVDLQVKHKFLVTVAVAAPALLVDKYYQVPYLNQSVDFINLMTYDFHFFTRFTPFTGLNAPLYPSSSENGGYLASLNINYTANYWNFLGMDKRKIMIGLPTYAHSFKLTNVQNNGLYAPARGYGSLGSSGFADYAQVCRFLQMNQISPVFDVDARSPYACKQSEWVSFENELSVGFKAEFIRDHQFGGAMIYCLNSDDYHAVCQPDPKVKPTAFPLIRRVHEILDKNYSIF